MDVPVARPPILEGVPTAPAIELPEPGGNVVLYRGAGTIGGRQTDLTVVQPLTSRLRIVAVPDRASETFDLGETTVELLDTLAGRVSLPGKVVSGSGKVELDEFTVGTGPVSTLVAHLTNLPWLSPAAGLKVRTPAGEADWCRPGSSWTSSATQATS